MDEEKRKLFEKRVENYEKAIEEKYGRADLISYTVGKTTSLFVTIKNSKMNSKVREKITQKAQELINSVVNEMQIAAEYYYESGYNDGKRKKN